jgi:hypothetical protein
MPEECAFCPDTANRSGEHLWSEWMSFLFPGNKRFINTNSEMKAAETWSDDEKAGWKPGEPKPFVNSAFTEWEPAFSPGPACFPKGHAKCHSTIF